MKINQSSISSIAGFLNSKKLLDKDKKKQEQSNLNKDTSQKSLSRSFFNSKLSKEDDQINISHKHNSNSKINLRDYIKDVDGSPFKKQKVQTQKLLSKIQYQSETQNVLEPPITNYPLQITNNTSPFQESSTRKSNIMASQKSQKYKKKQQSYPTIHNFQINQLNVKKQQQASYQYDESPTLNPNQKRTSSVINSVVNTGNNNKPASLWGDITNVNNTFNSSRLQSKQCLQNLSRRLLNQLQSIQGIIQKFTKNMRQRLEEQYIQLNINIKNSIDKIFETYKSGIFESVYEQQKIANNDIYKVKKDIELMYVKIQKMKEGIQSANWKKIAGELLGNDIEQKVQQIINSSQKLYMSNISVQLDKRKSDLFEESLSNLLKLRIVRSGYKSEKKGRMNK